MTTDTTAPAKRSHAIIGCGRVAPNHVDGFGQLSGWSVDVACDRDPAVARFAAAHGIPRWTQSVRDVLEDPSVGSVSIAVDHAQHGPLVRQALQAGKHVLVEKPICLDRREARELVAFAADRGLVLSTVAQHRYDPLVLALRSWVREGLLGDLVYVTASLQARRTNEYYTGSYWRGRRTGEGGSALINQGYHCLDAIRWICGDLTVRDAMASARFLGDALETEDTIVGLLQAADVPVTLHVTVAGRVDWRTRLEVVGGDGTAVIDLDHPGTLHHCAGSADLLRRAELERARSHEETAPGIDYYGISHRRQIADFGRAVSTGAAMMVPAAAAADTLDTVLDLYDQAYASRVPAAC
ncbi:Gfo/Idh/MocA family oxidoreductase [Dactylosporangium sp. NBC_01737]|uniref:Gfo/Idh/MocA family protein n=1 Tax=Dactylosporangium sp. NBC_01737 TaxID=2975959 RepID=UPI002E0EDC93|nr:Gfo/Idh/MocA family oxidoreductase [Dactylosporangium sp. NBC_01737]